MFEDLNSFQHLAMLFRTNLLGPATAEHFPHHPVHVPGIFMYLLPLPHLMQRYLLASAFRFLFFRIHKIPVIFGFGLCSSQSCHPFTEQ